jgi:hypothetical protein
MLKGIKRLKRVTRRRREDLESLLKHERVWRVEE